MPTKTPRSGSKHADVKFSDTTVEFDEAPGEEAPESDGAGSFSDAVVHATDWTTETILSQLGRGTILLNPRFQRRDAWDKQRKSRFIESLLLGLPIPQIVLAEEKERSGRFLVLDGKQRLLSLMQFSGRGAGVNNAYTLTGLEVRKELNGCSYASLEASTEHGADFNMFLNQPLRTVVIKNWPSVSFLHLVFLRLNTGSVKLSPQELRQALFPGNFTDFVDDRSVKSAQLQNLLRISAPDYRMRDVELLARFLAFHFFLRDYQGRLKAFIDQAFSTLNRDWSAMESTVMDACDQFEQAIEALNVIFPGGVARKPGSRQLNRAVLDALLFYATMPEIRLAMSKKAKQVAASYERLFDNRAFAAAVERDTAGVDSTAKRLGLWGEELRKITGLKFSIPKVSGGRVAFSGF